MRAQAGRRVGFVEHRDRYVGRNVARVTSVVEGGSTSHTFQVAFTVVGHAYIRELSLSVDGHANTFGSATSQGLVGSAPGSRPASHHGDDE
jgi:hypothetical protein